MINNIKKEVNQIFARFRRAEGWASSEKKNLLCKFFAKASKNLFLFKRKIFCPPPIKM